MSRWRWGLLPILLPQVVIRTHRTLKVTTVQVCLCSGRMHTRRGLQLSRPTRSLISKCKADPPPTRQDFHSLAAVSSSFKLRTKYIILRGHQTRVGLWALNISCTPDPVLSSISTIRPHPAPADPNRRKGKSNTTYISSHRPTIRGQTRTRGRIRIPAGRVCRRGWHDVHPRGHA